MHPPLAFAVVLALVVAGSALRPALPPPAADAGAPRAAAPDRPVAAAALRPADLALTRASRLGPFPARLLRVVDGDTIVAEVRLGSGPLTTRVRLRGIDAAELSATCTEERDLALAAREALARYLGTGAITLTEVGSDKYAGRIVARVLTKTGADVGARMLEDGYAIAYDGGRRQPWCDPVITARR